MIDKILLIIFCFLPLNAFSYGSLPIVPSVLVKGNTCKIKKQQFQLIRTRKELDDLCEKSGIPKINQNVFTSEGGKYFVLAAFSGSSSSKNNWINLTIRWHSTVPADIIVDWQTTVLIREKGRYAPYKFYLINKGKAEHETIVYFNKFDKNDVRNKKMISTQRAMLLRYFNVVDNHRPMLIKEWRQDQKHIDENIKLAKKVHYSLEAYFFKVHHNKFFMGSFKQEPITRIKIKQNGKTVYILKEDLKRIVNISQIGKTGLCIDLNLKITEKSICELTLVGNNFEERFKLFIIDFQYKNLRAKGICLFPKNKKVGYCQYVFRSYLDDKKGQLVFDIIKKYLDK